jgi:hypothetical protein
MVPPPQAPQGVGGATGFSDQLHAEQQHRERRERQDGAVWTTGDAHALPIDDKEVR